MEILLIEDSRLVRDRLTELLESMEGVTVTASAADVPGALACLADYLLRGRMPDLVVLDISLFGQEMSCGNGIDLLRHIKRRFSPVKVAVLTNYASIAIRNRCAREGADYFFDKSYELDRLTDTVHALQCNPPHPFLSTAFEVEHTSAAVANWR